MRTLKLSVEFGDVLINPGDTALVAADLERSPTPCSQWRGQLYTAFGQQRPAGATWDSKVRFRFAR